jgi:trans-2,3-dihydro-3-hydroxyanthranilate isomerase
MSSSTSAQLTYETVDVFTDAPFGGNPLAVVFGGERLTSDLMLRICREFNYSETTFVLPPKDPQNTAHVRIFTPGGEVPFAGHPNVGTAAVIASRGGVFGKTLEAWTSAPAGGTSACRLRFEEQAGLVECAILFGDGGKVVGAQLAAPETYSEIGTVPVEECALCLGIEAADIEQSLHLPVIGSVGLPFLMVQLKSKAVLEKTKSVLAHFGPDSPLGIHAYIRTPAEEGVDIRARMHTGPGMGGIEDPATGSANCALMGLLATLAAKEPPAEHEQPHTTMKLAIVQGVEMGRPSLLKGEADYLAGNPEVKAVRMGGQCVPMMKGQLHLEL